MTEPETVNLLDLIPGTDGQSLSLSQVKLGRDETALVPFTLDTVPMTIHYCEEQEVRSYVACAGSGCVLCKIGRGRDERLLLPVYVPLEQRVSVVLLSKSMRPQALLPQIVAHMKPAEEAGKRVVLFIRRLADNSSFTVNARHLRPGDDDGASLVKQFLADVEARKVNLRSIVQHLTTEQLCAVGSIARMLELKEGGQAA